ncbi:MAG TPA: class I SAM-dependent methyltransferase [Gemmatimonadota bacterium]|nr:class I SAM-dependent methyltransferase [Gemmatimonadota bacterium]
MVRPDAEYEPFPNIELRNSIQYAVEVPLMARLLDVPPGARILEVGCGRGIALAALARFRRPQRLVGVDIDPEAIEDATRRTASTPVPVELVRADVRALPFADGEFDVVIDFGTCYHVARPEAAVAEIARVLVEGGSFLTETRMSQALAHPIRTSGRGLPWRAAPELVRTRTAVLWSSQRKVG